MVISAGEIMLSPTEVFNLKAMFGGKRLPYYYAIQKLYTLKIL